MRRALLLSLALLPAACAHTRHHAPEHARHHAEFVAGAQQAVAVEKEQAEAPRPMLPMRAPTAASARIPTYGKRVLPKSETIRIEPRAGGWQWNELFEFVSKEAGVSIRYEQQNAVIKGKKVVWFGPMDVARADLIAWLQDLGVSQGLVISPHGPADRRSYFVMDYANAWITAQPTFVNEDDLPALSGRVGLYVSCVMTLPDGVEPSRARQALSQLSTKTAGLGRVNEVGKTAGVLVVADFAAVVANMRRTLDEMAERLYEQSLR